MIDLTETKQLQIYTNGEAFPSNIEIQDLYLSGNFSVLQDEKDFKKIPKSPGNYWILTNKPISHSFNPNFNHRPSSLKIKENELSVIYNGQGENLQNRIKQHLLRKKGGINDLSGISIDIIEKNEKFKSHNKYFHTTQNKKNLIWKENKEK